MKRLQSQTINPEKEVLYTIDLTREYHNLLQKEEDDHAQSFLWDENVAGMVTGGKDSASYYFLDELGSPIRLADQNGYLDDSYGYDEFGRDLFGNQGKVQPFGYTGYQRDGTAGTYFAQAREYNDFNGSFTGDDIIKGFKNITVSLNGYSYVYSNPLKYIDLNGKNAAAILEWGLGVAGATAISDSPLPGPMDVAALFIAGGTLLIAGGVAIYDYAVSSSKEKEEKDVAVADTKSKSQSTVIYRYGSGNATNLTPREVDITGLSYSLTPPPAGVKYSMTTIEMVNSTGVLIAVIDGANHVSVRPTNPLEMQNWINSRPTARDNPYYLTIILASISIKSNGGNCDVTS